MQRRELELQGLMESLDTAVITDAATLRTLIPEWDALSLRDPNTTPFDCGSMMIGLGEIFAGKGVPYVIVARTAAGELAAVLPLRRVQLEGRLGGHGLIGYPTWHASYFDASIDPDVPGARAAVLHRLHRQRDWDHCDLQYLRPDGSLLTEPTPAAHSLDIVGTSRLITEGDSATPPAGGVMSHKSARRLSKAGVVEFIPTLSGECLVAELRRFAEMHTERWAAHGESAEFATSERVGRLIYVMQTLASMGVGRVGCLRLSGTTIAVHLGLRWRGTQYSWRMAHDAAWHAMSPGRLLMSLMIEDAIAAGCRQYDLGRGSEGYKELWTTTERPLYRMTTIGSSWRARLAVLRGRR